MGLTKDEIIDGMNRHFEKSESRTYDWQGNPLDTPEAVVGRDPVNHYMRGGLECIDAMRAIATPAEFQAYCRLTAFKYLWRIGEKDDPVAEAKKAMDYARWMYESLEGGE
jgi:hypothetical protein